MTRDGLRGCPLCATPVEDAALGLRDFKWLGNALPGRVGPADIDMVVEQSKSGRILMLEFKPPGAMLPQGQRILLTRFVKLGADVWVVWEEGDNEVTVGALNKEGRIPITQRMPVARLRQLVADWWSDGARAA